MENCILKINAKDANMMAKEAALNAMREYYTENQKILDIIADLIVEKANEGLHQIEFTTDRQPKESIKFKTCSDWVLARPDEEMTILVRLFETNGFTVKNQGYGNDNTVNKVISW